MLKYKNSEMFTPIKAVKGMPEVIKQRIKAVNDLFSTAISGLGNQLRQYSIG